MQKNVSGTVTSYILHGRNVVQLTQGSNNLHFFYGADGSPAVVVYNGAGYGYVKNLQGDVVSIVNSSGTEVVHYSYDAWGRLLGKTGTLATSLGTLNPFRYRGYVYDEETGLYYLRRRYYNPGWGRFVNADSLAVRNLYAYCKNNAVMHADHSGALADDEDWSLLELCPWLSEAIPRQPLQIDESSYFRKNIMPRVLPFLKSKDDYSYHKNLYIKAKRENGSIVTPGEIACAHLMYEVVGKIGNKTAPYRYSECKRLGIEYGALFDAKGNLKVELVEGMEVYKTSGKPNGHVGMLLLYDFGTGRGLEWAVFQSASCSVTLVDALFEDDTGPNITAFYGTDGTSKWENYTAPRFFK